MRKIFLPTLKKIKIKNFTLYPNGLDYEYDFINGVNVIIGGNGMGKTTFVNLIKYSILGHYKKDFDFTRTYKDRKIEKRTLHPVNYYKDRLDPTINTDGPATITIDFYVNDVLFSVERCIETITLNSFEIGGEIKDGKVISQRKYEELAPESKDEYLLKKYEDYVEKFSGLSFDDLILFVNEILFFGEDHKTILWNDGSSGKDIQNELFNKYFNTPELDKARQEAERQAKYFDSSSRHRSEDIRAIKKVLDKILSEKKTKDNQESLNAEILNHRNKLQKLDNKVQKQHKVRKKLENEVLILNNNLNVLSLQEENLEKSKKVAENKLFENKYINLHKNYDLYYQSIKTNHICPLCTKEVSTSFVEDKVSHSNNCIVCNQEINEIDDDVLDSEFRKINEELLSVHTKIQKLQKDTVAKEEELKEQDQEFKDISTQKRQLESELRNLEFSNSQKPKNQTDELQAFYDEIESLEKLKNEYQEKSKIEKNKAEKFSKQIEAQISKETNKFSLLFSQFAGEFLGVKCSLTYDDLGEGGKRFYPVINGKIRQNEEALSESQRFFIDHSFRMSILSFFYTKPSFYIVETPDSSLDVAYEKNAAKVFMKFLENDNALILTTNLNNSAFLNHLVDLAKNNISIINLLDLGKKSIIQRSSDSLQKIYKKLKEKIK